MATTDDIGRIQTNTTARTGPMASSMSSKQRQFPVSVDVHQSSRVPVSTNRSETTAMKARLPTKAHSLAEVYLSCSFFDD